MNILSKLLRSFTKSTAVISCCVLKLFLVVIFISEDESENSQDYPEFKAKREFLMSGLPESLKKKIAKKAAVLEAYSAANSCFQKVIHVQQKDNGECWPFEVFLINIKLLNVFTSRMVYGHI